MKPRKCMPKLHCNVAMFQVCSGVVLAFSSPNDHLELLLLFCKKLQHYKAIQNLA